MKLFKGGYVVTANGSMTADVLIDCDKIMKVANNIECDDAQIIDVTGKLLFPGFIDAHTHFNLEVANTVTADDFHTGSLAALKGGTTTIIDFATQNKGETLMQALSNWHNKAQNKTGCDYSFHMAISDWNMNTSEELPKMFDEGITSFKLYMTYPAMMLNDKEIYQVLKRLKELGGIVGVHCENSGAIDALILERKQKGKYGVDSHPLTRPAALEAEAISRLLRIAELVDTPVIIVHLSTKEGLKEVTAARKRGQKVYVETCPQYLLLDDSLYNLPEFEGARYVCAPPLRKEQDINALWNGLKKGLIQTVSTDHCSFTLKQKEMGKDDFTKIPGGMPGVETRAILMYTYGVTEGRISIGQMCRLLSENPAKLYGLYPQKGCIAKGSDADIVIYNPAAKSIITAKDQLQNVDYSPFEGFEIKGAIEQVYLRGSLVVDNGKVCVEDKGRYIKRKSYML